jgi:hypothetical protein
MALGVLLETALGSCTGQHEHEHEHVATLPWWLMPIIMCLMMCFHLPSSRQ